MDVKEYETEEGVSPFSDWFNGLDRAAAMRIYGAITRMEHGNFGDHKGVGAGVMERRLDVGPGYRIYFGRDGEDLVILVGGGTKRRQQRDIETAKAHWAAYKRRKKKGR